MLPDAWDALMAICVIGITAAIGTAAIGRAALSDTLDWLALAAYGLTIVLDVLLGWWAIAGIGVFFGALWFWRLWRRHRKNRKRAPRAYGYKAKAALAALVRKAREAAKPKPVLRPVPGGAR